MLRKILVIIDAQGDVAQAAKMACWLAKSEPKANVSAIAVADTDSSSPGYAVGIGGMSYRKSLREKMHEEVHQKLVEHEEAFSEAVRAVGISSRIIEKDGPLTELVNRESLSHDIIVASLSKERHYQSSSIRAALSSLIEQSTRPVIVVGPDTDIDDPGPLLVAMNGSSQSSRALNGVAQLGLARDNGAIVACIGQSIDPTICEDAADYLQAHDFKADVVERQGDNVATALLTIASEHKCCMIAMGGYSGSRLVDWVLGSTTDDIITKATVPVYIEA